LDVKKRKGWRKIHYEELFVILLPINIISVTE
jgi:hypothetical protein